MTELKSPKDEWEDMQEDDRLRDDRGRFMPDPFTLTGPDAKFIHDIEKDD